MNKFKTWICEKFFKKEMEELVEKRISLRRINEMTKEIVTFTRTNKQIKHLYAYEIVPVQFVDLYCDDDYEKFIKEKLTNSFNITLMENYITFSKEKDFEGNITYKADLWAAEK